MFPMSASDVLEDRDEETGDILRTTGENPVVHPGCPTRPASTATGGEEPTSYPPTVVANFSLARLPRRRLLHPARRDRLHLTAAEAHQLGTDLIETADHVGQVRVAKGFDA